ncbi:RAD51-associated protein 1 isoform X1 [Coregonus clupeaformis]|uniref:RAD51-associated protein 1 isoform X1 n=2 Tax=Coregonus clupeaformis TaxID=59861 RepID=UPI001E1C7093|nr:RAD51-associated protein 1 isoform X1 [Coregonus clupeaformis]
MARPTRAKNQLNYSDLMELDDDEDFACMKGPSSKKARVLVKEPQRDKSLHQSSKSFGQDSKNILSLDDKENEVGSQASCSLSVLQIAVVVEKAPSGISLLEVTSERGSNVNPSSQRRAAIKAKDQQRSILKVERMSQAESGREDKDYQSTCTPDSESEQSFDEEDESDEEFTAKKVGKGETGKKNKTAQPPASKKADEKKLKKFPKSKLQSTSESCSPTPATSTPVSTQRKLDATPTLPARPSPISPVGGRLPKWNPPAQSGISPSSTANSTTKSPGQGLRLGLSRLARVKPLHPTASGN